MLKKTIYIFIVTLFVSSCADTFDSVKRGLTGEKQESTDEFMIKKKDPLIMPPDYENLPTPEERVAAREEISNFEKSLGKSNLRSPKNNFEFASILNINSNDCSSVIFANDVFISTL